MENFRAKSQSKSEKLKIGGKGWFKFFLAMTINLLGNNWIEASQFDSGQEHKREPWIWPDFTKKCSKNRCDDQLWKGSKNDWGLTFCQAGWAQV